VIGPEHENAGSARPPSPIRPGGTAYLDPLELLVDLGRHRRMLVLWPATVAVVAAVVSMLLPVVFTGTARILPPQAGQSSGAAMLSQLSGLAGVAGGALGLKNPSDLYVGMLQSTTVADALIDRFKLMERYEATYRMEARKRLAAESRIVAEKNGIITIEAGASDPRLAADLANAYVEELHELINTLAVSEAAQRRLFFERQLKQTRDRLADAETKLREAIDAGGLVSVDAQSRVAVETAARLRAEISARTIQLEAMRAYATSDHPDLRRVESELASMRQQLGRIESGSGAAAGAEGAVTGVGNIRLVREMKYQEVMFELLARQLELARADEAKEAPVVQVLDTAQPPERRSSPQRARLVVLSMAAAFMVACMAALARAAFERSLEDPARRDQLTSLRSTWRWRGR
jgi:uncharacterized protein involved in exopolysaccharide biosynthesis